MNRVSALSTAAPSRPALPVSPVLSFAPEKPGDYRRPDGQRAAASGVPSPVDSAGAPAAAPQREEPLTERITTCVLVNTYNQSEFIEDCIDSLLVQTVLPDEIVVYDDGSTDDTVARLHRYGSRILVIRGTRMGLPNHRAQANAIHTAFTHSTGKLVFLLDGDDRFKRDKIESYVSVFRANPDAALIQAPMDKIDQHGRHIGNNIEPRKHVVDHLRQIYQQQDVDLFYPTSALAFSRAYLQSVLPLDFSDGYVLWSDTRMSIVAPHFGRVITLPEPHTEWRRHLGSDSIKVRSRRLQLRQTLMRTRVFNRFCRVHGLRTISPWRNRRFYLQLLRFSLPDSAYNVFYKRLRPRLKRAG